MSEESDPFECRLMFLSLLQKLNASQQSIHKVASYAMRHRKLSEDLYSCIIEQLDKVEFTLLFFLSFFLFSFVMKRKYTHTHTYTHHIYEYIINI
jgi:CTD kinase subunit gamma